MKLFTKNTFRNLALAVLGAAALSACGGAGSCVGCAPVTPAGDVTLKLTAPNQYPAGVAVTAYLTMTNTSSNNATNLYYDVPNATNYTGTTITVANGLGHNNCVNIAAGASCTFPTQIAAGSHPGSFTVTATPNGNSSQSTVKKLWSSLKSDLGLQAGTLSLMANIGLTDVPANTNSGANGISFLYSSTIAASESGETLLSVVAVVNSAEAGTFNTINLTDVNGTSLYFDPLSGNSGQGLTNLANGSVVSFLLHIPAGATSFQFYAQTMKDGSIVNQGSIPNNVILGSATQGILVVQPTDFALSAKNNYESQVVTLSNIGNGSVTGLTIPTPSAPLEIVAGSNTCGTSLTVTNTTGSSCSFTVKSNAHAGTSGQGNLTISSNNGSAIANYTYAGVDPIAGVSVTSGDNPTATFISNTESSSFASQFTLKNTGNVSESNFTFTVPQYFTLSAGTTGIPCSISNNVVTTVLANHNDSCTLTLTYTNATVTSSATANLLVDYSYHDIAAPQSSIGLSYQTVQASGLLQVTSPLPLPYTFPSIRGNTHESQTQVFVVTNVGNGTASSITRSRVLQAPATYNIMPTSTCGSSITSLAPGASCQITVRFGPVAVNAVGTSSKTVQVDYLPYLAASSQFVTIAFGGTVTAPYTAKIILGSIVFTPAAYESGSHANPFQIESGPSAAVMTFSYKNDSLYPAYNFIISTDNLPDTYTLNQNNCNNVTLNGGASCTVVLSVNRTGVGALPNINLQTTLTASYNDDVGSYSAVQIYWIDTSVYTTVYAAPSVTAVISSSNTGSPVVSSANAESDIYVVYTLSGGYNVGTMTYGVDLTNAAWMSVVGSPSCNVSGQQSTCFIQLNVGSAASNQVIAYTTTGSVNPTSANSGSFDVLGAHLIITPYTTNDFGDILKDNTESSIRIFKVENIGTLVATGLEFYDTPDEYDMYVLELSAPVGTPTPLCDVSYHADPLQRPSLQATTFCYYALKFGPAAPNVPLGVELNNSVVAYYSGLTPKTAQESMIGNVIPILAANLVLANNTGPASPSNGFVSGDGSSGSPYIVPGTLSYQLTNVGPGAATNVIIRSPAGPSSYDTAASTCDYSSGGVTLLPGASCLALWNLPVGVSGEIASNPMVITYNDAVQPVSYYVVQPDTGSSVFYSQGLIP